MATSLTPLVTGAMCAPTKRGVGGLAALLAVYLASVSFAQANPANLPDLAVTLSTQGAGLATLALLTAVATTRRRRGCTNRRTWVAVTGAVLALNMAARVASRVVDSDGDGGAAKYVRWDAMSTTVAMVAVTAEIYYAMVPRARLRTTFFVLGLLFVLPMVLAVPRLLSLPKVDPLLLGESRRACGIAYSNFTGADPLDRVVVYPSRLGDTVYVAFAGTETRADAATDVDVADVQVPWLASPGRAHRGFSRMYDSLRAAVKQRLSARVKEQAATARQVVFTGHSLGGALAYLAALDYATNTPGALPSRVVTFGAPQVGDRNLVTKINAAAAVVRVVNPFDPVPKLLAGQLLHPEGYYPVASLTSDAPPTAHDLSTYELALSRPRWAQLAGMFAPASYVAVAALGVGVYHLVRRRYSVP